MSKENYMVMNIWGGNSGNISFYCNNDHDEPIPFSCYNGENGNFYACPKYYMQDEDHLDGYRGDEKKCFNRISYSDVAGIVEAFGKVVGGASQELNYVDFTNYKFKYKYYSVCILDYGCNGKIKIGIVNHHAINP